LLFLSAVPSRKGAAFFLLGMGAQDFMLPSLNETGKRIHLSKMESQPQ
jgi:hypothetical protein